MRLALAAFLLLGAAARAADMPPNMEKYYLVLLRRPATPAPPAGAAELEALQQKHLGHLRAMHAAGKMVVAGPFGEQKDPTLRGLCLYRVGTADEARQLAEQDPMVKARRLEVDVLAWWVEKGVMRFGEPAAAGK